MDRQTVGERLAGQLYVAEAAIDAAIREVALLAALLPVARAEAEVSATTGQGVFDNTAASLGALTQARGRLADAHQALAVISRRMGLDILALGPVDKPEDRPPGGGVEPAGMLNKTLPSSPVAC